MPLLLAAILEGPFPIVTMTYNEDGSVDYESIAKQVEYASRWDCAGVVFGQSNDAVDLLSDEEKLKGFEACVGAAEGLAVTIGLGVNGTNAAQMVYYAQEAGKIAAMHPKAKVCFVARPTDDSKTSEDIERAWDALGAVAVRPVIFQTHGLADGPEPTVEAMARLSAKYPDVFGYVKEESSGDGANIRMIEENGMKPPFKCIFSGWGGWQWLHQLRQCGSGGLITERIPFAPLLGEIWRAHSAGDRARTVEAFAMYRMLIDQRNFPDGFHGYQHYALMKLGLAKNLVYRAYRRQKTTDGGNFGDRAEGWKLDTVQLSDRQRREVDLLLDDMFEFVTVKKVVRKSDLRTSGSVVLDNTPTRVQTLLKTKMRPVGTLVPKSVGEVSASRWTLDCGGMDREHCDWRAIRGYVAPLGIARIRQQAGWARGEKDPGRYDFAYLDQVVDDADAMGVKVWMELSYGNPAYPGGGGRHLSAGFPKPGPGLDAWFRWVEAMAKHYRGKVTDWCIWNEPNNHEGGNSPAFAADFAIRTAEILKREIPSAKIAAFALSWCDPKWVEPFVMELERRGKAELFDSIAYHHYSLNPDEGYERVEVCRRLLADHAPNLRLWEGEGGGNSEWGTTAGFSMQPWTETLQAKYDLRRALGDLGHGDDTSIFHLCDLEYRNTPSHSGWCRFGLVKTSGQADSYRVLKVKMSYYAIQNAVSVFNDDFVCLGSRTTSRVGKLEKGVIYDWVHRRYGTKAVVFWDAASRPSESFDTHMVEISMLGAPLADPVWVDLMTGDAYAIDMEQIRIEDGMTIYIVPAYDAPTFITSKSLLRLEKSPFVQNYKPGKTMFGK